MPLDSRISLRKLEIFCAVVRHRGMSAAGEELMISQPGVSAHVRTLEERVGAPLLDRKGGGIELTQAGAIVHAWALDVLTRSNATARQINELLDGSGGSAAIASSMTAGTIILPPILVAFQRTHPTAKIGLTVAEPEQVLAATEAGECDFSLVMTERASSSRHLAYHHLREEELALVGSVEGGPTQSRLTIDQLREVPFVCAPTGVGRRQMIDRAFARHGLHDRNVVMTLGYAEPVLDAVREGVGVALVFRANAQPQIDAGRLREIHLDSEGPPMTIPVYAVHRRDKHFSPLQQRLLDLICQEVESGHRARADQTRPAIGWG